MAASQQFVLVHGSCHGAWCWYKLAALLKSSGHRVTAIDLGASGINPKQYHDIESFSDYVQPLMEFMSSLPRNERVILVGHSYGGLPISIAMERFPEKVLVAVFLAAYMADYKSPPAALIQEFFKRVSPDSLIDCKFTFNRGIENPPTSVLFGPEYMRTNLYKQCPPEDLELAKVLIRPAGPFAEDLTKEGLITENKYGSVKRIFLICESDELMKEDFQQWMIEKCPPTEVKVLNGADHMIMLSNPEALCRCLQEILHSYHDH